MSPRRSRRPDPIEHGIEMALALGDFVGYPDTFAFVAGLDQVANEIASLIRSDPKRAVSLYETFLGGVYEKADCSLCS